VWVYVYGCVSVSMLVCVSMCEYVGVCECVCECVIVIECVCVTMEVIGEFSSGMWLKSVLCCLQLYTFSLELLYWFRDFCACKQNLSNSVLMVSLNLLIVLGV